MNEKKITFRMAEEKDAGLVMSFIHHLSVYEEMEGSVQATEELLRAVSYTHLTLPTKA